MSQEEHSLSGVTGVAVIGVVKVKVLGGAEIGLGTRVATPEENPSFFMSSVKIDRSNYLLWSCSCKLFIKTWGLEDYNIGARGQRTSAGGISALYPAIFGLVLSSIVIVTYVYLMTTKSEVEMCFQVFHKMISNQFEAKIKVLRSNKGSEYKEKNFQE